MARTSTAKEIVGVEELTTFAQSRISTERLYAAFCGRLDFRREAQDITANDYATSASELSDDIQGKLSPTRTAAAFLGNETEALGTTQRGVGVRGWRTIIIELLRSAYGSIPRLGKQILVHPRILVAGGLVGIVAFGYLTLNYIHYQRLATVEHAAAERTERANVDLQDALARLRNQLGAANQALSAAQDRIATVKDAAQHQPNAPDQSATSESDRIAQLTRALEQAQREFRVSEAHRVTLMAQFSQAEVEIAGAQAQLNQQAQLYQRQRRAVGASPEPVDSAAAAPSPIIATAAPPAPVAKAVPAVFNAVVPVSRGGLAQFERVLASAGVDVASVFSEFGVNRGEGGPFIAAPKGSRYDRTLSPEKLAALRSLVKVLPVSAPLENYELGSGFGVRVDPINGRSSFHTGLDFVAPYMSPVYATAAGIVVFAGYRDDYGKVVEIDHGNGIATRYSHLHRATVVVGQRIGTHAQIGFLGSTGRATGPHVHYEVLVNGEPQNPEIFLKLGQPIRQG